MKLLDTTFLIHYWGGREEVKEYLETHDESEFITTTLNIKEIGVGRALQGQLDRAEIQSTFRWIDIVPFDIDHAYVASELEAKLHRDEGVNQDRINAVMGDLLIAAVAKERNATVVTQNTDDYKMIDNVSVESYLH